MIDSDCRLDARRADEVRVRCEGGASCSVDCREAEDCELSCAPGSKCLLRCAGAGTCRITDCTGMQRSCEGSVLVCARSCP